MEKKLNERQSGMLAREMELWSLLTEDNEHTEVRMRIADFFDVPDGDFRIFRVYSDMYAAIQNEQTKRNGISKKALELRQMLDDSMFHLIGYQYGDELSRNIKGCL